MSTASEHMRSVAKEKQLYGYAYFVGLYIRGYPYKLRSCEICFRHQRKESSLAIQISNVDLAGHTYNMLVGFAEPTEENNLVFHTCINYEKGGGNSLRIYNITCFDQEMSDLVNYIVRAVHSIIYRHIFNSTSPRDKEGVEDNAWNVPFDLYGLGQIQSGSEVKIEDLVDDLYCCIPHT